MKSVLLHIIGVPVSAFLLLNGFLAGVAGVSFLLNSPTSAGECIVPEVKYTRWSYVLPATHLFPIAMKHGCDFHKWMEEELE